MGQALIDEKGNRYGTLTVKELTKDKNGRTAWLCECDCGRTKIVRGPDLRKGRITTCGKGCPLKHFQNYHNLKGQYFGLLTVIERVGVSQSQKVLWKCICECGNETVVETESLVQGATKSCGCLRKQLNSESHIKMETPGTRYGFLEIISPATPFIRNHSAYWTCKCLKCGSIKDYSGCYLRSGNTKSCGCLLSWKEEEIKQILIKNNIPFEQQYIFSDLKGDFSYLRFDFALFKNQQLYGLIEYQGEQHFELRWNNTEEDLQRQQYYDFLKVKYCEQHSYLLLILDKTDIIEERIKSFYEV